LVERLLRRYACAPERHARAVSVRGFEPSATETYRDTEGCVIWGDEKRRCSEQDAPSSSDSSGSGQRCI